MFTKSIVSGWSRLVSAIGYLLSRPRMLYGFMRDREGQIIKQTRVGSQVFLYHKNRIDIGENVWISNFVIIDGTGGVTIGNGCQIGPWTGIFTHSSHISIRLYGSRYQDVPESERKGYITKAVSIGEYTFIGARTLIMPGVAIGKGCLVYAGSTVISNVPDYAIVQGNPAHIVGDTRQLDARYLKKDPLLRSSYTEWAGTDTLETCNVESEGSDELVKVTIGLCNPANGKRQ